MKILVIGSGGREHALVWKLKQSARVSTLFCAPGNAGIAQIAECIAVDTRDPRVLADLAESVGAQLTIIGPEAPLVAGVADEFARKRLRIVGPTAGAARLEGSKIFAKQFMQRHRIPTARFAVCDSVAGAADNFARYFNIPVVVKADGLAAGKGVRIAATESEFHEAVQEMMVARVFGDAGSRVVVEECLTGREASLMLFTDGRDYKLIAPAQDYKRVKDDDAGPNTGGMGSFSTPGLIDVETLDLIERQIIQPTLAGLYQEDCPFKGFLYVGLMLTAYGPKVIEYNCRLGDPETQVVMMRLSSDLVDIAEAIVNGSIGSCNVEWSDDSSVCVVAASAGYPGDFKVNYPIAGLHPASSVGGAVVFHAGTKRDASGNIVTSGGRVLGVTALRPALDQAREAAYEAMRHIGFEGLHYRKDIARTHI
ncbi:MAG TPA: phosphoribosylamine--glycine ligase [Blastocatellia bacterium]|nr:phosphoribosylamine--glycine ligase [Blastocatellia bacterium]